MGGNKDIQVFSYSSSGDIKNLSHGRDQFGLSKLKADLKNDLEKAKKTVCNLDSVAQVVRKWWVGEDADKFLKELSDKAKEVKAACNNYEKLIETALDEDMKNFTKMQKSSF